MACIIGMESISEPEDITVITDSQYVIGCATLGWKRKKNVELWKRFDKAMDVHKDFIEIDYGYNFIFDFMF